MIRLVAAMGVLAFAVSAPAWAQERRLKHELRQEQKLAETPEPDVPELDVEEAPEAGENDVDTAREVFTTDDLEGLDETPGDAPGEGAPDESSEGAELIDPKDIPPDAGRPEASATPGGPTFQEQMSRLLVDLQYDRASGRQFARAPERGKEPVIQEVSLAIRDQLLANECWSEEDTVIPGRRESIAIAVRFDADGRFIEEPRLVSPPEMPPDDLVLRMLIDRTFGALRACNVNGFKLPPQYFEDPIWVYFILQSRPE